MATNPDILTLLQINEAIASSRSKDELFQFIFDTLKPLYGFDDAVINLWEEGGKKLRVLISDQNAEAPNNPNYQLLTNQPFETIGTPYEDLWQEEAPSFIDLVENSKKYPDFPGLKLVKEMSYQEDLVIPLLHQGNKIGVLELLSKRKGHLASLDQGLLHRTANQLAIAVSNILANEEILRREQEKTTLLKISEKVAEIRNWEDLFSQIFEVIQPVFHFKDAVITLPVESQAQRLDKLRILATRNEEYKDNPNFFKLFDQNFEQPLHLKTIYDLKGPRRFNLEEYERLSPGFEGVELMKEYGLKATWAGVLVQGTNPIGSLEFHYESEQDANLLDVALFENVLHQLSVAVSNILANEDILERQREKEMLLGISEDVTTVRDRDDLFKVIMNRLQPFIGFQDAVVIHKVDDENFRLFLNLASEDRKNHELFDQVVDSVLPLKGSPIELFFKQDAIYQWKAEDIIMVYPEYPGLVLQLETGLDYSYNLLLKSGNEVFGLLIFHFDHRPNLSLNKADFYNSIADQVAMAIANILANEEILERQREKEILLSISEAATTIRDREALFHVIMDKLYPILGFKDAVATQFNDDQSQFRTFLTASPGQRQAHPKYKEAVDQWIPVKDTEVEYSLAQANVFFLDTLSLAQRYPESPGIQLMKDTGLNHSIGLKLKSADGLIGICYFHFEQKPKANEDLLKGIAEQLSLSITNILANEEILARQQEKDTLLGISEDIALVRNKEELWNLISTKLQGIFGFQDAVVVRDIDGTHHQHMLIYAAEDIQEYHTYNHVIQGIHSNKGTTWDYQMSLDGPHILYLEDLMAIEAGRHHPGFLMMKEMGRLESFGATLSFAGEKFGFLWFHYLKDKLPKEKLFLFGQVADQIAAAVSNILANEEILERQREKETLLSITEQLGKTRNKEEFWTVVMKEIKPIFNFNDAVIVVSRGDHHHEHLVVDAPATSHNSEYFEATVDKHPNENSPYLYNLESDEAAIVPIDDWAGVAPQYSGALLMKELGLVESFRGPLFYSGKKFGLLWFHYKEGMLPKQKFDLFTQVSDSIAAAISNILANEEILERQKEKEDLLSISESISSIRNRDDLFRVIMDKLKPHIPFDDVVVISVEKDKKSFRHVLNLATEARKKHDLFESTVKGVFSLEETGLGQLILEMPYKAINAREEHKRSPDFPGWQLMLETGLNYTYPFPLTSGGEVIGYMLIHFKDHYEFSPEKQDFILNAISQISVAVSNILANEEILARQEEKETLLSISREIAKVRNRDDLYQLIRNKVRPHFPFDEAILITLRDGEEAFQNFLDMANPDQAKNPVYRRLMDTPVSMLQPPIRAVMDKDDFELISVDEELETFPDFIGHKMMKENGLDYSFNCDLKSSGRRFGTIFFHFKERYELADEEKPFLINLVNQVSIAVSNIMANDDLYERQREKETLLALSESIAKVKNRQDLYNLITEQVAPHIPFDAAVLVTIDDVDKVYRVFLDHTDAQHTKNPIYRRLMATLVSTEDAATKAFFNKRDFELISVDEEIKRFPDFIGHRLMKESGFNYSYKFMLKSSGKIYGVGAFHFRQKYIIPEDTKVFLSNVISQLSVAVSNIISVEEIELREHLKSLQAHIAQSITSGKDWPTRFETVAMALKDTLPFDYISFAMDTQNEYAQGCAFEKVGFDEYRLVNAAQFFKRSGMTIEEYKDSRQLNNHREIKIWSGEAFQELLEKDRVKNALSKLYGLKSNLNVPLSLSQKGQFQISLYSKKENAYSSLQLDWIRQLLPSIVHPLEKVLAFEQIERLNTLLKQEKDYLEEEIKVNYNFEEIVGTSEPLQEVFVKVTQVAPTDSTVLITGESGTGKELIARALHNISPRKKKSLIKLNCATLPPQLLESELFGHEKGAFTGADKQRIGKFELANNGTIFLDEIGEMPIELQAKLLRVIQEKEFERIGGNTVIKTNARIIAATNRQLELEVTKGNFRSDLYFRINVFPIHLPPLRARKEDITPLAIHFLKRSSRKLGKRIIGISSASLKELMTYDWPGNIRELEHVIERAVIVSQGNTLDLSLEKMKVTTMASPTHKGPFEFRTLQEAERELILNTMRFCNGRVRGTNGAAKILNINPSTLESRMKKLGIRKEHVVNAK